MKCLARRVINVVIEKKLADMEDKKLFEYRKSVACIVMSRARYPNTDIMTATVSTKS